MKTKNNTYYFLNNGGEMGELMREKDWQKTSLGSPETWPHSLRTTLSILLNSKFPMYLFWGPELLCFYNDAFRPSLGNDGKHPKMLGEKAEEQWAETWAHIKPMIDHVLAGNALWNEDQVIPIYRNEKLEDAFWTYSYSPIFDELENTSGVFVTCTETTDKVHTLRKIAESEENFRAMSDNIPNLAWMADAEGGIFWYNKKWYEYTGTTPEQMTGWGWQSVHDPNELPKVLENWRYSITSGEPFEMIFPIKGSDGQFRQFLTRVLPLKNKEGKIYQWFGSNTDITAQKETEKALHEGQQRFYDTVKQAPVGITILRGDNFLVEMANDAYLFLIDKKESDFVGKPLFDSLPEVEASVHDILKNVIATGIPFHGNEYPIPVNRYGKFELSYFDFLYYPLREKDGEISGIIVTVTDVSLQVISRNKVKESDLRFRHIADSAPVLIWMADTDKLCTFFNKGWLDFTGRTIEEESGNGWTEGVHPDDYQKCVDIYFSNFDKRRSFYLEYRHKRYDGEYRWLSDKGVPRFTVEGVFEGYIGACMDIHNEKKQQQELIANEQKFRLLANSMPQHVWTSDTEGNLNYFNQSVLEYSGLTLEQIKKDGWIQIVHPDDREDNIRAWTNSVITGEDFLLEHRFRHHSGNYHWQLSRAIPQKDKNGKIQMWVGTSTDIQDQKNFVNELESQVLERTKELEQKNKELQRMNKELQSFAYISSHDLQEPLRKIQMFSKQIVEMEYHNLTENGKHKFGRMDNAARRMQILIQDLLTYSRIENNEIKFETLDINSIIEEAKEDLSEEIKHKKAVIEICGECEFTVIPFQFRQLLYNLISNSLKFTLNDRVPVIKIESKKTKINFDNKYSSELKTYCHITISDNGIGFEQLYNEKIFEVFQRLHAKDTYNGTGIGLAIVKKIVENHSGVITAKGELNIGATFDIYIPTT